MKRNSNTKATTKNYKKGSNTKTMGKCGSSSKVKEDRNIAPEERVSPSNDPAFYSRYPELVSASANLFFSEALGTKISNKESTTYVGIADNTMAVPGIMAINYLPTIGASTDGSSPANSVSRAIYSFVRHANSGSKNYDAPDLMLYLMAMDSMYQYWSYAARMYGILRLYAPKNRYLAKYLVEAAGGNYEDLTANMAQFRYELNSAAVKLNSFAVPKDMAFFTRHVTMCSGIYSDAASAGPKSQLYLFKPYNVWKYSDTGSQYGGSLGAVNLTTSKMTVASFVTVFNDMYNAIMYDEDLNIMSGDILKAYGTSGIYMVPQLPENYTVIPAYDDVILSQIENCTLVGRPKLQNGVTQDPNTGVLVWDPAFSVAGGRLGLSQSRVLNMHVDNIAPIDVMEATRLMVPVEEEPGSTPQAPTTIRALTFGSEIPCFAEIYTLNYTSEGVSATETTVECSVIKVGETATPALLSQFNRAPMFYVTNAQANPGKEPNWIVGVQGWIGNLDNYATIPNTTLEKLHTTAMLSLLDVPRVATASK